jgi:hypothetical protein
MIDLMNKITDKEGWERKVMDDTIAQKWRQEALGAAEMDVSDKMFDWESFGYTQYSVKHVR